MSSTSLQALLVRDAILTIEQVRHAVASTRGTTMTWLEYLLLSHLLDEDAVVRCVGAGAGVPRCDLERLATLPGDVLAALPRDLAVEHRMVPVSLEPDGDLSISMVDPCDVAAVHEIEFFLGRRVLREVAPATPMAWALRTYYGAEGPLWPRQEIDGRALRLARGSVPPPIAPPQAYEIEISDDPDDVHTFEVIGRARFSADQLLVIAA